MSPASSHRRRSAPPWADTPLAGAFAMLPIAMLFLVATSSARAEDLPAELVAAAASIPATDDGLRVCLQIEGLEDARDVHDVVDDPPDAEPGRAYLSRTRGAYLGDGLPGAPAPAFAQALIDAHAADRLAMAWRERRMGRLPSLPILRDTGSTPGAPAPNGPAPGYVVQGQGEAYVVSGADAALFVHDANNWIAPVVPRLAPPGAGSEVTSFQDAKPPIGVWNTTRMCYVLRPDRVLEYADPVTKPNGIRQVTAAILFHPPLVPTWISSPGRDRLDAPPHGAERGALRHLPQRRRWLATGEVPLRRGDDRQAPFRGSPLGVGTFPRIRQRNVRSGAAPFPADRHAGRHASLLLPAWSRRRAACLLPSAFAAWSWVPRRGWPAVRSSARRSPVAAGPGKSTFDWERDQRECRAATDAALQPEAERDERRSHHRRSGRGEQRQDPADVRHGLWALPDGRATTSSLRPPLRSRPCRGRRRRSSPSQAACARSMPGRRAWAVRPDIRECEAGSCREGRGVPGRLPRRVDRGGRARRPDLAGSDRAAGRPDPSPPAATAWARWASWTTCWPGTARDGRRCCRATSGYATPTTLGSGMSNYARAEPACSPTPGMVGGVCGLRFERL